MMSKIKSFDELKSIQERLKAGRDPKKPCITICVGTGCLAYGTQKLVDNFREELAKRNLAEKIEFRTSGCHGFCERGPMVVISPEKIFYQRVGLAEVRVLGVPNMPYGPEPVALVTLPRAMAPLALSARNLPAGTRTETYVSGWQKQSVTVGDKELKLVAFNFKAAS